MTWNRKPAAPVVLPPEVEITVSEWDVRFHGILIGSVETSGNGYWSRDRRGLFASRSFPTRDEAVMHLIDRARS